MSLALGIGISPVLAGKAGVTLPKADSLAGAETNVIAMDFTDLSTRIRDTVTPANNYTGTPFGKLSVTRAGVATYFDANGVLQNASANTPRLDYHPRLFTPMGVLIEDSRINLCLQSQDFTQAVWTVNNGAITPGSTTGLDGAASGTLFIPTNGSIGSLNQNITFAAATQYNIWMFAKSGGVSTNTRIRVPASAFTDATDRIVQFSFQTKNTSVPSGTVNSSQMFELSNGWFVCSMSITVNNAGAVAVNFLRNTTAGDGVNGNYICGCQVESSPLGTGWSSYIPTTTVSVTRAADQINMATSLFNWSNTQCTMYMQGSIRTSLNGNNNTGVNIGDGTLNNRNCFIFARNTDDVTQALVVVGGTTNNSALITSTPLTAYQRDKVAMSIIAGTALSAKNGNPGTAGTPAALPAACTSMILGAPVTAASQQVLKGWIAALMVLPITKTQAQLNAMTT